MTNNIKRMSVKEFTLSGYLMEVNRRFLHPLGLGLEVIEDDETGEFKFGEVWDYRDNPEGIVFNSFDEEDIKIYKQLQLIIDKKHSTRNELLGFIIQPIQEQKDDD